MDTPTPNGGTQNIHCPRCATLVRTGAHFCRNCGAPVAGATMRHPGIGSDQLAQAITQQIGGTVTGMPDKPEVLQGRISDQPAPEVQVPSQTSHGTTPHKGDGVEKSSQLLPTNPPGVKETPPATTFIAVDYQQIPTEKKL